MPDVQPEEQKQAYQTLLHGLRRCVAPDRRIDLIIARFIDPNSGPIGIDEVPTYTSSPAAALELGRKLLIKERIGFSWEPGAATAVVAMGSKQYAATAPIAICAAIVDHLLSQMPTAD